MDDYIDKIVSEVISEQRTKEGDPRSKLAGMIDHTILKPEATEDDIRRVCEETVQYGFATACISACWVSFCASLELAKPFVICTIVGFPLGGDHTLAKAAQAAQAVKDGADELDMVMNVGFLKSGKLDLVEEDIRTVVKAAGKIAVKVIIETCLLTDEEKVKACLIAQKAGAAFVKTSTGFNEAGANPEDVKLMRRVVGPDMGVKASGGIRTYEQAMELVEAGANRIGTSASVEIVR